MKISIFITTAIAIFFAYTASAQVYQWTDQNGHTVFTNVFPPPGAKVESGIQNNTPVFDCASLGKLLFERLTTIRDIGPIIQGAGTPHPLVAVFIEDKQWKKFSDSDRKNFTCYMPVLTKSVIQSPDKYLDVPITAPAYRMMKKNIANINPNSWQIITGAINARGEVNFDQTIAKGKTRID